MVDYLILTEKSQAANQFEIALGGKTGIFNGHSFQIVHAQGHLLKIPDPQYLVKPELKEKYQKWSLANLPWNCEDFHFHYVPKSVQDRKIIEGIKTAAKNAKAIVIATDVDPSGEGESIAWEIINAIGWEKPVYREYHDDFSAKSIKKALMNMKDVSNPAEDGDLQKAIARQRWDYLSQQYSRFATLYIREAEGEVSLVPVGRLKSVMVDLVAKRLDEIQNYVKKPYYEVGFQDENGHWYLRKKPTDEAQLALLRHASKADAEQELQHYSASSVVEASRTLRHQAPGKLIDMSRLDGILAKKGYSSTLIKNVYQKLYLANYVSYPRTGDEFVTPDQFNELAGNSIKLAQLVGVDPSLLTYHQPRKKLVKDNATHGANRPGSKVPQSLDELSEVVNQNEINCAKDIYVTVTKSALTMFAPDYAYDQVVGKVQNNPEFTTTINIPKDLGWKAIFNNDESIEAVQPLGKGAQPKIKEGANPKPAAPTKNWLYRKLSNYGEHGVGTPATQQSTMATITDKRSNKYLLTDKKGKLGLSSIGRVSALMTENCLIASPNVTIQLFTAMDEVGKGAKPISYVVNTIDQVTGHDVPLFKQNAQKLVTDGVVPQQQKNNYLDNYVDIDWEGQKWRIKKSFGAHKFTDKELQKLQAGEKITFPYKGRSMTGKLAMQRYKSSEFLGFKPEFNQDQPREGYETVQWNGQQKQFKKKFGTHIFSSDELAQLKAGKNITFPYKGRSMTGKLAMQTFNGHTFLGFKPDFN